MLQLTEMDDRVRLADQLSQEVGPVILVNTFRVAPQDSDALVLGQPPNLPFTVRRLSVSTLPPGPSWPETTTV